MRYIFFGTPEFASIVLEHLLDAEYDPLAIICNPDRPMGRKNIITPPPAKQLVQRHNERIHDGRLSSMIQILQPEKLDDDFKTRLAALHPDFFIVAAYGKIIPQSILDIPPQGTIGVHPSLLPRFRGASPIQSVILEGEPKTGATLYLMDEQMDHGPVLAEEKLSSYDAATARTPELLTDLAHLSGEMLVKTLPKFVQKEITPKPQDESAATYTKKFKTEDGFIDEELLAKAERGEDLPSAHRIDRSIRALNPEPGIWTMRNSKRVKLLEAVLQSDRLKLKQIQFEGKKPQKV